MAKGTFLSSPTYDKQLEYKHNRKGKSYLGQTGLVKGMNAHRNQEGIGSRSLTNGCLKLSSAPTNKSLKLN